MVVCYTVGMPRLFKPIKIDYKLSAGFRDIYPLRPFYILRGLAGRQHNAWDIVVPTGTPVHAPERMQVHDVVAGGVRSHLGYGKFVRAIALEDQITQYYFAHLNTVPYPRRGKIWQVNELFAWTGESGWATGPHLHFAIKRLGQWVDPGTIDWV